MDALKQLDQYDAALSSLYEVPTDPTAWVQFMAKFADLGGAHGGQYHLWDAEKNRMGFSIMPPNYPESESAYYNEHLAPNDPRRQLTERAAPGQWVFDYEHFDAAYVDRSELFRWLISWDIRYGAAVRLANEGSLTGVRALFRSPSQQPFGTKDRRWLERITPHVLRASRLHLQLESLRSQVAVGWHASSSLDYPIMIADENGQVLFANLAAEALFAMPQTPLKCRQGRVTASMPSVQGQFSAAIRTACSPTGGRGEVLILQSDLTAPAYRVVMLPLPQNARSALPLGRPLAVITMGSTRTGAGVDAELLQQLFGLSAAEARVVTGIRGLITRSIGRSSSRQHQHGANATASRLLENRNPSANRVGQSGERASKSTSLAQWSRPTLSGTDDKIYPVYNTLGRGDDSGARQISRLSRQQDYCVRAFNDPTTMEASVRRSRAAKHGSACQPS